MKLFCLKTKTGDKITTIAADDLSDAQDRYAKMKNLSINDLLAIFIIEEVITTPKKHDIF